MLVGTHIYSQVHLSSQYLLCSFSMVLMIPFGTKEGPLNNILCYFNRSTKSVQFFCLNHQACSLCVYLLGMLSFLFAITIESGVCFVSSFSQISLLLNQILRFNPFSYPVWFSLTSRKRGSGLCLANLTWRIL